MNPVVGVISILIVAFIIFNILVYQWIDKSRFDIERYVLKASKGPVREWAEYLEASFPENEQMQELLKSVSSEKKFRKKTELIMQVYMLINSYCDGNSQEAADHKKIRKTSLNYLKEYTRIYNLMAEEYNEKLGKPVAVIVVKLLRLKEVPVLETGKGLSGSK